MWHFQEVIESAASSGLPRLQGREWARGMAPHFTTTLAFRHLWDIRPGVSLRSLSRFIVAVTDRGAVAPLVKGSNYDRGFGSLAADGVTVIVCLQWHRGREEEVEEEEEGWW